MLPTGLLGLLVGFEGKREEAGNLGSLRHR